MLSSVRLMIAPKQFLISLYYILEIVLLLLDIKRLKFVGCEMIKSKNRVLI